MTARLSRRSLLSGGVQAASLALSSAVSAEAATTPPSSAPSSVVLVRLRGGADGLSLLVPCEDDHYRRARPSIAVRYASRAQQQELTLERGFALHPRLAPLKGWFERGELGAIVGVGLPQRVGSHRRAWRELDQVIARASPGAVVEPGPGRPTQAGKCWATALQSKLGPRVLTLDLDGWDVHVAQGDVASGRHADACGALASELVALQREMCGALSRVLVVVITEFGRTLTETPLRGTDDSHASVMLCLGGHREWGHVLGTPPALQTSALEMGRHPVATASVTEVLARLVRGEAPL